MDWDSIFWRVIWSFLQKQYFGLNGMLTVMAFLGEIGLYDGIFRKLYFSNISRIKVLVDGMFGFSLDEKGDYS